MNLFDVRSRPSGSGPNLVSTWMRQGFIRSIQTGTMDLNNVTSKTATITAVDLTSAILLMGGATHSAALSAVDTCRWTLVLTNSTTVTAARFTGEATAFVVEFTVLELLPGILRSVRAGTIELNGGTSNTAAITSVNTSKSWLIDLGMRINQAAAGPVSQVDRRLVLTNSTTVTATIDTNPGVSHISSFMVAEFF